MSFLAFDPIYLTRLIHDKEMFLPSYIDHEFPDLERKQDPVQDIILTDEEAAALLPQ
jgi:hypothetical protein